MVNSRSPPKQPLSDPEFLPCCINSISNGGINYAAVAKAAKYANDGRARARLSRINSKHGTRPHVSKNEEFERVTKKSTKDTKKVIDSGNTDSTVRVTRSSTTKATASSDTKVKKKKRTSSA
ncbi:uncharacterized protein DFL_004727 [Arthrobotrys flagrans]|uniref:Myb-like DNA-binding domain-containing protein n=1 Tax=Arthrobotrys flagrans TaxID=97331 RepID=A0A437A5T2_ARTFL|nr:hypothetical protein DFL_004727 [Arthrobotrys flagrans]